MSWILSPLIAILIYVDALIYTLVSYVYKLFMLVCQINFNSLAAIIGPLIDRLEAVIMVFIMFKLGVALIQLLLKPEDTPTVGSKLIKNIFIVGIMLICYNLVFSILNEVSMLIIGVPEGYSFTTLNSIANVTDVEDNGLINRFIFGEDSNIGEVGDFIALKMFGVFLRDAADESQSTYLENAVTEGDTYNFFNAYTLASEVNKNVLYTPFISGILGIYMIYCIGSVVIEVAVRVFKLLVLQLVAPVAIITKLNDKSDMFNKYTKLYFSTYTSVFFRIFSVLVINVFISKFIFNLDTFFGNAVSQTTGITKLFLLIIVVVAGLKFIKDLPNLLKELTGQDFGGSSPSFGGYMSGLIGGGIGAIAGGVSAYKAGAGKSGVFANIAAGGVGGYRAGSQGDSISKKIANITGNVSKGTQRAQNWAQYGSALNAGRAKLERMTGVGISQDRQINHNNAVISAADEYDKAQTEAIKDIKMGSGEGSIASELVGFDGNFADVKFGDNKDAFAEKMLEYNTDYINEKAALEVAQRNGDKTAIATAMAKVTDAKNLAIKNASDVYDKHKSAANNANIDAKRTELENLAGKQIVKDGDKIDVKATKEKFNEMTQQIQNTQSYQRTHKGNK